MKKKFSMVLSILVISLFLSQNVKANVSPDPILINDFDRVTDSEIKDFTPFKHPCPLFEEKSEPSVTEKHENQVKHSVIYH